MLSSFFGIVLALVVFMIIVGFHEWGHFSAARAFGVKVFEFGLGIPPKLLKLFTDKKGTQYTLNWLPLGGFVRLKGESFDDRYKSDADALFNKPIWQQMVVVLAGIFMNFVLAGILFSMVFILGTKPVMFHFLDQPSGILGKIEHESILIPTYDSLDAAIDAGAIDRNSGVQLVPIEGSIAQLAGVTSGDIVLRANDIEITDVEVFISIVQEASPVRLDIKREGQHLMLSVVPEDGKIGTYVIPNLDIVPMQYGLVDGVKAGFIETKNQIVLTGRLLRYMLVTWIASDDVEAKKEVTDGVGGPIAIGNIFVGLAQQGVDVPTILIFGALISISLGVFNLLPIPALDGGRFLVLAINGFARVVIRRDIVGGKMEGYIHALGFLLMIVLAFVIAYKDVLRILG